MFKKRHKNPHGYPSRTISLLRLRKFFREMKIVKQSLADIHIDWVNFDGLKKRIDEAGKSDYIAWLGHATYLLQLENKRILIDPFFSRRASPFKKVGPERYVAPPLKIAELPKIDFILITHNHYDHLDLPFLRKLTHKDNITVIVPSSLGKLIKKQGYKNITELAWHENYKVASLTITALPVYHYSKRGLFDKNVSHWCAYAISTDKYRVFHSGDTGYGPIFKEIGQKYGPFDFAMLGIGAYQPVEIMKLVHTNPEEALQIAIDLHARTILPMHWGTIVLSTEPIDAPLKELTAAMHKRNISDINIQLKKIGDLIIL